MNEHLRPLVALFLFLNYNRRGPGSLAAQPAGLCQPHKNKKRLTPGRLEKFCEWRSSERTGVQGSFKETTSERKNKGTWHTFCIGFLSGYTYHIHMYAPAGVRSEFKVCGCNESALHFSACACLSQDAKTKGQ
eukprot:548035-Pelagomonas_calceolata.AAC.2